MVKSSIKKVIPKRHHHWVEDLYVKARYAALFPLFRGNEFECPLCRGRFRRMLPKGADLPVLREKQVVGAGYRLNSRCPRCDSFDRERLVYLYLRNKTRVLSEHLRLLHVGPEKNLRCVLMARPNIEYLSADLDSPLAQVRMDIRKIEYPDGWFDVIICNHVLQDILEDRKAISELYRILRPGG